MQTPFWFVVLALAGYALAHRGYGRWYVRSVWRPDARRTTPAHLYADGVECLPLGRPALRAWQYQSGTALGAILGPFIATRFGWAPALAWIVLGGALIGWLQDYGAIMLAVRNQGRSPGSIAYEFTGAPGRSALLGLILFHLLVLSAALLQLVAHVWNLLPGSFAATLGILLAGVLAGLLQHRLRLHPGAATLVALGLAALSFWLGTLPRAAGSLPFGPWNGAAWAAIGCAVLYLAAAAPLPAVIWPLRCAVCVPACLSAAFVIAGALLTPLSGVHLAQPAFQGFRGTPGSLAGGGVPLWPVLFTAMAGGAVSGWNGLVGAASTARHLQAETDAYPAGAGAMFAQGLLAAASLAAYMVLSPEAIQGLGDDAAAAWVAGASLLTRPFLGWMGEGGRKLFFGTGLALCAITVQVLVVRLWRRVAREACGDTPCGRERLAALAGLLLPLVMAVSGAWNDLWLAFGGANQLLAGLMLLLITVHLARVKAPGLYTALPAAFLVVTTLAAIALQTWRCLAAVLTGQTLVQEPLRSWSPAAARVLDWVSAGIGLALLLLGARMAVLMLRACARAYRGQFGAPPLPRGNMAASPAAGPGRGRPVGRRW